MSEMIELAQVATDIKAGVEAMKAELSAVKEKQELAEKQLLKLQQQGGAEPQKQEVAKSLYHQFVESAGYQTARLTSSNFVVRLELGDPVKSGDGMPAPARDPLYKLPVVENALQKAFPVVGTTAPSIEVICEKKFTNNAASIAEGAAFPKSGIELERKTFVVRKIGHMITVTKETLEDAAELANLINERLPKGVLDALEGQLLNGTGSNEQLAGLMKADNFVAHGFKKAQFAENDTIIDLVERVVSVMEETGRKPSILFVNPMGMYNLTHVKDSMGHKLFDPATFPLKIVKVAGMPDGKFLVADEAGAALRPKRELEIEVGYNGDDMSQDRVTMKASVRTAFVIRDPNCFMGGDLKMPAA